MGCTCNEFAFHSLIKKNGIFNNGLDFQCEQLDEWTYQHSDEGNRLEGEEHEFILSHAESGV